MNSCPTGCPLTGNSGILHPKLTFTTFANDVTLMANVKRSWFQVFSVDTKKCGLLKEVWRARRDLNPGPLPKNAVKQFFSGVFPGIHVPRGKSNTDAFEASPMLYLTELRALGLDNNAEYQKDNGSELGRRLGKSNSNSLLIRASANR